MKQIIIKGNKRLTGTIRIGGAKNSVVALMPAALLTDGVVKISNVPNISDKDALLQIMELLGSKVTCARGSIVVDSKNSINTLITENLSRKLRASYYFMGVLLGKYKHAEVFLPGGCNIGTRPIDQHLKGFRALGAEVTRDGDKYILDAPDLHGADILLDFASVGATINIMFAAVLAKGTTRIRNAACETEIVNIADLLVKMGAKIDGAGTSVITIKGVKKLHGAQIRVIPDRIEAGTYIIVGALTGDNLVVSGVVPSHLLALFNKLDDMNVKYRIEKDKVYISKATRVRASNITTLVYPGFPTDLGQPIQVLLTQAKGKSKFKETIWENRMGHVPYLVKMGAKISAHSTTAIYSGPSELHGAEITATDLRGGAALVLAGLLADGETVINDADYILRGYERIIQKLSKVGANIEIKDIS